MPELRAKLILIICVFFSFFSVHAQEKKDVVFSGTFKNMPFVQFANEVENQTGIHIYYHPDWVEEITINAEGEELSLRKILSEQFATANIKFYIDSNLNIYLTGGTKIITELPDYSSGSEAEGIAGVEGEDGLTEAERNYITGRKALKIETIVLGNDDGSTKRKAVITGKIKDADNYEPLIGATVYIEDLKIGAVTDLYGQFSIVLKPGKYNVTLNSMGMKEKNIVWQVYSNASTDIMMESGLIALDEVQISASSYHNVEGIQMGYERVSLKKMKEIPVVLGEKDIIKVALMLPGVQSVGEGSSGINVRGGSADQNMFYINKVPVYNTSHLFGFFTSFNPEIVNDFTLYKSNIPANYGGRLSSIFNISSRNGNKLKTTAHGGISPVTLNLAVEGPIIKEKVSYAVSARTTYSDWILKNVSDYDIKHSKASFYDLTANIHGELNEKNQMNVFGYYSSDDFRFSDNNIYNYSNAGASVNLNHSFSPESKADFSLAYSKYQLENVDLTSLADEYSHSYSIDHLELRSDFSLFRFEKHMIEYGLNSILYINNRGEVNPYGTESLRTKVVLGEEKAVESAIYISDKYSITPRLTLNGGLRYSFYSMFGPAEVCTYPESSSKTLDNIMDTLSYSGSDIVKSYSGLEPRVSFTYLLRRNNSIKASYNRLQQYLFLLSNTFAISPTDYWKMADYYLKPSVSDQVSIGYYQNYNKAGVNMSVELYRKWSDRILEFKDGADFFSSAPIETQTLQGKQDVKGVELMVKKTSGKFTGWMSYTYSKSTMLVDGDNAEDRINYGLAYPSNYDRPHSLNLASTLRSNRRLSVSLNMVYYTGRPTTFPVAIYYVDGRQYMQYSQRNEFRIPDYFRMDLSINLEGNLRNKKIAHSFWMLNFYNLTGRSNAYSVFFTSDDGNIESYKLSIFNQPIVTLSWNFKLGNYASN